MLEKKNLYKLNYIFNDNAMPSPPNNVSAGLRAHKDKLFSFIKLKYVKNGCWGGGMFLFDYSFPTITNGHGVRSKEKSYHSGIGNTFNVKFALGKVYEFGPRSFVNSADGIMSQFIDFIATRSRPIGSVFMRPSQG